MQPIRALIVKNDVDLHVNCYLFEIHFESEIKTLLINLTMKKAYFTDHCSNNMNNYFSTEWVNELLDIFKKNQHSEKFEYEFGSKSIKTHSPSFFQNIIHRSRENSPVPTNQIDFEPIQPSSHFGL